MRMTNLQDAFNYFNFGGKKCKKGNLQLKLGDIYLPLKWGLCKIEKELIADFKLFREDEIESIHGKVHPFQYYET